MIYINSYENLKGISIFGYHLIRGIMRSKYFACLLSIFVTASGYCQVSETPEELLTDGNFFFSEEDYQEAIYYFIKLDGTSYMNANTEYKIGTCYLNIQGEEYKSIDYLEKASKNISASYKAKSLEETKAPLHTLFYLGQAYHINNELDKALETLTAFKNVPGFEKSYNQSIVDNEIQACEKAKIIGDIPIHLEITHLTEPINTGVDNYNPVISYDQHTLVFVTNQKFYEAILMSLYEDGQWTEPVNITPQVESDGDAFPTSLSSDGKTLYMVRGAKNNRDIFVSHLKDGFWTKMEPLNDNINSARAESHASISADGKTLYFTSNRSGGYGEMDIYRSTLDSKGSWGPAVNLGPVINTSYNEETPFISADGKTLFFSSQGHYNMGGYDIFSSTWTGNAWTDPVNVGFPLNTTGDNLFFQPINNGQEGYMAAIRPEGFGKRDIYLYRILGGTEITENTYTGSFTNPEVAVGIDTDFIIRVTDQKTGKLIFTIRYDREKKEFRYEAVSPSLQFKVEK
jgi:tetratricopeptide (TPR) repeat protein